MKYILIILIAFISCGMGQYPLFRIGEGGKVYNENQQTKKDTVPTEYGWFDTVINGQKSIFVKIPWYIDSLTIPGKRIFRLQFDSIHFYVQKELFWQKKYEKEIKKLNRTGHKNDISQALLRFQDSVIRYKLLLSKLKKY